MALSPTLAVRWQSSSIIRMASSSRQQAKKVYAEREPVVRRGGPTRNGPHRAQQNDYLKGNENESLWQSWRNLSFSTRIQVAIGMAVVGTAGLLISDHLEKTMPVEGQQVGADAKRRPKLIGFTITDRQEK